MKVTLLDIRLGLVHLDDAQRRELRRAALPVHLQVLAELQREQQSQAGAQVAAAKGN